MTINNRRLEEVKKEILDYEKLLDESQTISECLIYQGKLESLYREEKEIKSRYDVIT